MGHCGPEDSGRRFTEGFGEAKTMFWLSQALTNKLFPVAHSSNSKPKIGISDAALIKDTKAAQS